MYESTVSDADTCSICLSPFEGQRVASLEGCQHVFCLACILQWSQTATTCPVDRTGFDSIHQIRCPGGAIHKKIEVKTNKREDDYDEEEEANNTVLCEECGRGDRRRQLRVCLRCDSGYHTDCLTPSSSDGGPGGDWICAECAVAPQPADDLMVEAEISDGELADLLAEVDESGSNNSTRLRPASSHGRSSSAHRRHSQRIQSSAMAGPPPRARAPPHVPRYLLRLTAPAGTAEGGAPLRHSGTGSAAYRLKRRKRRKRVT
ncbi:PHD and RING finger domain-containing protein 1-like isoform 2-T3 [Spinachia spinachia]